MKRPLLSNLIKCLLLCFLLVGCFEKRDALLYKKGIRAVADKNYSDATKFFTNAFEETADNNLKLAVSEKLIEVYRYQKQYDLISKKLEFVVLNTQDRNRRLKAKQELADNNFFKTKNYNTAIEHYSHLVEVEYNTFYNRFMIARSYYYLNNMTQSEYEVDELLKESLNNDLKFESLLLKANIFFSDKEYRKAADAYVSLTEKFPKMSKQSFISLHLAMSYEQNGLYKKALETLESLKTYYHSPQFIQAKIDHIQGKLKVLPGARGLKK